MKTNSLFGKRENFLKECPNCHTKKHLSKLDVILPSVLAFVCYSCDREFKITYDIHDIVNNEITKGNLYIWEYGTDTGKWIFLGEIRDYSPEKIVFS